MLYWGQGPTLGLLTCLGYLAFLAGALYLWRYREELAYWMDCEFSVFRRVLSRHVPVGPFYEPRGESRLRVIPVTFLQSMTQLPRRRFSWGAFLLFFGFFLFLLDFFV